MDYGGNIYNRWRQEFINCNEVIYEIKVTANALNIDTREFHTNNGFDDF